MKPVVYKIEFPDGKCYIGSTVNFAERRRTHLRHGKRGEAVNPRLAEAFRKYPICGIYIVAESKSREVLHITEQQVMFDEQPALNMHISPDPLPAYYNGSAKPLGPHPSIRFAAHALGIEYNTLKRLASRKNYDYPKILDSLAKKDSPKKPTCTHPLDPRKQSALVNLGTGWERRADILTAHGVTPGMYKHRIAEKWPMKDALTTPPRGEFVGPPKPHDLWHRTEVAPGVTKAAYAYRIKAGWTEAQALGLEERKVEPKMKRRYLTANGKTQTLDDWATELGLKTSLIHSRLGIGWTEPQALGLEPTERASRMARQKIAAVAHKKPKYTHNGVSGSLSALARHFGVPPNQVYSRQKQGWPQSRWFEPYEKSERICIPKYVMFGGKLVPLKDVRIGELALDEERV